MQPEQQIAENLAIIRAKIAEAAQRSGRTADAIKLVAVTKYVSAEIAGMLVAAGCTDLGENRPQELWSKAEALQTQVDAREKIRWHLIGHLQRNKVARTLPLVSLVHSADSLRLLKAIDSEAAIHRIRVPVLLEINISGDAIKHGFHPTEIDSALPEIEKLKWISVRGLMGMASREGDLDQARREFSQLRLLRNRLQQVLPIAADAGELSMGMSGDFETAIEEGATIVRVGSALFEGIDLPHS